MRAGAEAARSGYEQRQRERSEAFAHDPKLIGRVPYAADRELRVYVVGKPGNPALMLHNFDLSESEAPEAIGRPFHVRLEAARALSRILGHVASELNKLQA